MSSNGPTHKVFGSILKYVEQNKLNYHIHSNNSTIGYVKSHIEGILIFSLRHQHQIRNPTLPKTKSTSSLHCFYQHAPPSAPLNLIFTIIYTLSGLLADCPSSGNITLSARSDICNQSIATSDEYMKILH